MQHNINCPHCGQHIDVNAIVYDQLSEQVKLDFGQKATAEKKDLETKIRKQLTDEKNQELASYKEELERKVEQVKEFNKTKAELERTKREKEELRTQIEAEAEQKLSQLLNTEKTRLTLQLEEKNSLKLSEREHIIEQLKNQLKEAQRKAEQGSMQIQGEVQEEAIESWLRNMFPLDIVDEIKKGSKGADCIQTVNCRSRQNCGRIYYESKRTKDFQNGWIEKFKADMREKGALFGVLVTEAYPKGHDRMLQMDGIWVCSMSEFKGLCQVIRESVIILDSYTVSQENRGEKMHMLYDYLVGNDFRQQIEAIVEGFTQMNEDLTSEKRSMEAIWKKRQKQIEKVLLNTTHMFSTVKGIAGPSIGSIELLELPSKNN